MKLWWIRLFLLLLAMPFPAWANCSFLNGTGMRNAHISLPSVINVAHDAPVGSELWNSGWEKTQGADVNCTGYGNESGKHASGIGAAVPGFNNAKGRPYVYATNVPGIGISIYFSTTGSGFTDSANGTPLTARYVNQVPAANYYWNHGFGWFVRLVKTGPISGSEPLQIAGLSEAGVHSLTLSRLTIGGSATFTSRACEVDVGSKYITVTLPPAHHADFMGAGALVDSAKARSFSIDLRCDAGMAVSYRIDATQAGSVADVIANRTGADMASGVGIQLFQGDASSTTVQPLGITLPHVVTAQDAEAVSIPLTAKYYRTALQESGVKPGRVSASATFTLTYE